MRVCPPDPMNHSKIFKGWSTGYALRSWYLCGAKHFHPTMMVGWKWKPQLDWVIKQVPHDLVRRIRFWRIKSTEQDFTYLYWTISKIIFWNLFTGKGSQIIDWVGRTHEDANVDTLRWGTQEFVSRDWQYRRSCECRHAKMRIFTHRRCIWKDKDEDLKTLSIETKMRI